MQVKNSHLFRFIVFVFLVEIVLPLSAQEADQPNIILIVTDDQRASALGHAGNDVIKTPHMDQLAREGLYFSNAFVTTPICAASRASILTGLYERTHDFTFGTKPLAQSYTDISYPRLLGQAGYHTGFFGKLGVRFENHADTALFDEIRTSHTNGYFRLVDEGRKHAHLTDITTDHALKFIDEAPADKPFCVSISYNAPHADDQSAQQYFWPVRFNGLYDKVKIPQPELGRPQDLAREPTFLQDSNYMGRIRWHWRYDTPEKYQRMVKGYYRMITAIDDNLGKIRDHLEKTGRADNTIIILIGDNGYFLGERSFAGKWLMYENSLRVPLIVYDPTTTPRKIDDIALNIDIAPTILDYAGVKKPRNVQGESLRTFTAGGVNKWRNEFICEHLFDHDFIPRSEGIRQHDWKYFRYLDRPDSEQLHHLSDDPQEINNLADDPKFADVLEKLRKKLDSQIRKLDEASF